MNRNFIRHKRSVMALAGSMILLFHLWLTVWPNFVPEQFFRLTGYIGVDIFFLLSAYSMGQRDVTDLKSFYLSRFRIIYVKYAIFCVIALIYGTFKLKRFLPILFGIELFTKGGGAFLWFVPAVIILYILMPFFQRWYRKQRVIAPAAVLAVWFIVGLLVTNLTKYRAFFIFWNRIPVIMVGFLLAKADWSFFKTWMRIVGGVALFAIGSFLLYKFGFRYRLQTPIRDFYYITAIPSVVGISLLADFIPEWRVIGYLGAATLEMYGFQMIYGFDAADKLAKLIGVPLAVNALSFLVVAIPAVIFQQLYNRFVLKK